MKNASYTLENIILLESAFRRDPYIDFESENFSNHLDIQTHFQDDKPIHRIYVTLSVKYEVYQNGEKVISSFIKMVGSFTYNFTDKTKLSIEDFATINAPAIIFPFIREHLANQTMKAGIQPVLLPPVNFVKLAKEKRRN